MPKKTFICQHCGKHFEAYDYPYSPNLFCSKPCHYAARSGPNAPQWKRKLVQCDYCDKQFYQCGYLIQESKGNYCSRKCAAQHTADARASHRQNGRIVECGFCGQPIYKPRARLRKVNFCSVQCLGKYRKRRRITIVCSYCGKKKRVKPSHYNKGARFCSWECARKGATPTTLEMLGYQLLESMEFVFYRQYRIGKFVVDAFIPTLNLVVQFDGDYWHDKPEAHIRDTNHNSFMDSQGIRFIRVRQSELTADYNILRRRIIEQCELPPSEVPRIPKSFVPQLNHAAVQPTLPDPLTSL